MNYLEIINKCLVELNYKQVNTFSELIKNDHKKLKNIINLINKEICSSTRWDFLQRKASFILPAGSGEVENNINGRIETIIIDGQKFEYCPDFEKFFVNAQPSSSYSFYDDKILFSIFNSDKNVEVLYYTKNCVKDASGNEQVSFQNGEDESLIPSLFAEPLLVYGACMRLKGNPQNFRFSYWLNMYNDALANMRSKISSSIDEAPEVKIRRR